MATVSYTIYSHYDPQAGKNNPETSLNDSDLASWEFDPTFKPPAPPPRFVPATSTAPSWGFDSNLARSAERAETPAANDVSNWYRSLTSKRSSNESNVQPRSSLLPRDKKYSQPRSMEKRDKNNWFIFNAIQSNPETQITREASSSTLADIIARDPPPLPDEKRYKPPVWLEIGPSNKGFAMLQRSGWREGEPLGSDVAPRSNVDIIGKGNERNVCITHEVIQVDMDGYDDVVELRQVDVIDLTTDGNDNFVLHASNEGEAHFGEPPSEPSNADHCRTALLTPIATVLKSDRLGIGLKAKTVGPYKASRKRITHNAAALAAHARAAEDSRLKKKLFGRGSRGFNVQQKRDESDRKHLLAYLND